MTRRSSISDKERQQFRDSVGKVRRIKHDRLEHDQPLLKARLRRIPAHERKRPATHPDGLSDQYQPEEIEADEALLYARPGLQHSVVRKLRRGQFEIDSDLDLHGMNTTIARMSVARFLDEACDRHARCVLIIHGKGYRSRENGPVLKIKVNNWLQQRDEVLAFCSALPRHGGNGAVYVLLRRGRRT